MPKAGVPQSRARREATTAKAEARQAIDVEGGAAPRSVLAQFMRRPSKESEAKLRSASAAGELTTIDVQAALAQDIVELTRLARMPLADIEAKRPLFVARQRALKLLVEVIELAPSGGASVLVQVIWPGIYAGFDPGDQVRTRDDEEAAAAVATKVATAAKSDGWD